MPNSFWNQLFPLAASLLWLFTLCQLHRCMSLTQCLPLCACLHFSLPRASSGTFPLAHIPEVPRQVYFFCTVFLCTAAEKNSSLGMRQHMCVTTVMPCWVHSLSALSYRAQGNAHTRAESPKWGQGPLMYHITQKIASNKNWLQLIESS